MGKGNSPAAAGGSADADDMKRKALVKVFNRYASEKKGGLGLNRNELSQALGELGFFSIASKEQGEVLIGRLLIAMGGAPVRLEKFQAVMSSVTNARPATPNASRVETPTPTPKREMATQAHQPYSPLTPPPAPPPPRPPSPTYGSSQHQHYHHHHHKTSATASAAASTAPSYASHNHNQPQVAADDPAHPQDGRGGAPAGSAAASEGRESPPGFQHADAYEQEEGVGPAAHYGGAPDASGMENATGVDISALTSQSQGAGSVDASGVDGWAMHDATDLRGAEGSGAGVVDEEADGVAAPSPRPPCSVGRGRRRVSPTTSPPPPGRQAPRDQLDIYPMGVGASAAASRWTDPQEAPAQRVRVSSPGRDGVAGGAVDASPLSERYSLMRVERRDPSDDGLSDVPLYSTRRARGRGDHPYHGGDADASVGYDAASVKRSRSSPARAPLAREYEGAKSYAGGDVGAGPTYMQQRQEEEDQGEEHHDTRRSASAEAPAASAPPHRMPPRTGDPWSPQPRWSGQRGGRSPGRPSLSPPPPPPQQRGHVPRTATAPTTTDDPAAMRRRHSASEERHEWRLARRKEAFAGQVQHGHGTGAAAVGLAAASPPLPVDNHHHDPSGYRPQNPMVYAELGVYGGAGVELDLLSKSDAPPPRRSSPWREERGGEVDVGGVSGDDVMRMMATVGGGGGVAGGVEHPHNDHHHGRHATDIARTPRSRSPVRHRQHPRAGRKSPVHSPPPLHAQRGGPPLDLAQLKGGAGHPPGSREARDRITLSPTPADDAEPADPFHPPAMSASGRPVHYLPLPVAAIATPTPVMSTSPLTKLPFAPMQTQSDTAQRALSALKGGWPPGSVPAVHVTAAVYTGVVVVGDSVVHLLTNMGLVQHSVPLASISGIYTAPNGFVGLQCRGAKGLVWQGETRGRERLLKTILEAASARQADSNLHIAHVESRRQFEQLVNAHLPENATLPVTIYVPDSCSPSPAKHAHSQYSTSVGGAGGGGAGRAVAFSEGGTPRGSGGGRGYSPYTRTTTDTSDTYGTSPTTTEQSDGRYRHRRGDRDGASTAALLSEMTESPPQARYAYQQLASKDIMWLEQLKRSGKTGFVVDAQWEGRRYRISMPNGSLPSVKVGAIKRTLSKWVSLPIEALILFAPNGDVLDDDSLTGAAIHIQPGDIFVLSKTTSPNLSVTPSPLVMRAVPAGGGGAAEPAPDATEIIALTNASGVTTGDMSGPEVPVATVTTTTTGMDGALVGTRGISEGRDGSHSLPPVPRPPAPSEEVPVGARDGYDDNDGGGEYVPTAQPQHHHYRGGAASAAGSGTPDLVSHPSAAGLGMSVGGLPPRQPSTSTAGGGGVAAPPSTTMQMSAATSVGPAPVHPHPQQQQQPIHRTYSAGDAAGAPATPNVFTQSSPSPVPSSARNISPQTSPDAPARSRAGSTMLPPPAPQQQQQQYYAADAAPAPVHISVQVAHPAAQASTPSAVTPATTQSVASSATPIHAHAAPLPPHGHGHAHTHAVLPEPPASPMNTPATAGAAAPQQAQSVHTAQVHVLPGPLEAPQAVYGAPAQPPPPPQQAVPPSVNQIVVGAPSRPSSTTPAPSALAASSAPVMRGAVPVPPPPVEQPQYPPQLPPQLQPQPQSVMDETTVSSMRKRTAMQPPQPLPHAPPRQWAAPGQPVAQGPAPGQVPPVQAPAAAIAGGEQQWYIQQQQQQQQQRAVPGDTAPGAPAAVTAAAAGGGDGGLNNSVWDYRPAAPAPAQAPGHGVQPPVQPVQPQPQPQQQPHVQTFVHIPQTGQTLQVHPPPPIRTPSTSTPAMAPPHGGAAATSQQLASGSLPQVTPPHAPGQQGYPPPQPQPTAYTPQINVHGLSAPRPTPQVQVVNATAPVPIGLPLQGAGGGGARMRSRSGPHGGAGAAAGAPPPPPQRAATPTQPQHADIHALVQQQQQQYMAHLSRYQQLQEQLARLEVGGGGGGSPQAPAPPAPAPAGTGSGSYLNGVSHIAPVGEDNASGVFYDAERAAKEIAMAIGGGGKRQQQQQQQQQASTSAMHRFATQHISPSPRRSVSPKRPRGASHSGMAAASPMHRVGAATRADHHRDPNDSVIDGQTTSVQGGLPMLAPAVGQVAPVKTAAQLRSSSSTSSAPRGGPLQCAAGRAASPQVGRPQGVVQQQQQGYRTRPQPVHEPQYRAASRSPGTEDGYDDDYRPSGRGVIVLEF